MNSVRSFNGVISSKDRVWQGQLNDVWGVSFISDITLEIRKTLKFTKQYSGRTDLIHYDLIWNDKWGWFEGNWTMVDGERDFPIDEGTVKLYLVPSTAEFFVVPGVLEEA